MRRAVAVILVLGLVGCTGAVEEAATTVAPSTSTAAPATTTSSTMTSTSTTSTTTTTTAVVEVVEGLVFSSDGEALEGALLDVYALPGGDGGPLVVVFHCGGGSRQGYRELAVAAAERGAVVFVPDWQGGERFVSSTRDDLAAMVDRASCAVSYALAHAAEYGADPERLVLFGHSAGAMVASVVGLREAIPQPGCAVEVSPFQADGMVLWEGDWLLIHPDWDQHGDSLPLVMEEITPWAWLAGHSEMSVDLLTTAARASQCGMTGPGDPFWLRDPDGWFRERLEALGALTDRCIDVGETNELLADTMREQGFDVIELFLAESTHNYLSRHDQALVVAEIIAIPDR